MKRKLFGIILSFILILSQSIQPIHASAKKEWNGEAVSSGDWVISNGNNVTIDVDNNGNGLFFENSTLTIEEGASLTVESGILRFNNSQVTGTVEAIGDGKVRPWGETATMEHVVINGGTLWGSGGAIQKVELINGSCELFGAKTKEVIQEDGESIITKSSDISSSIDNYTINGGVLTCQAKDYIQTANVYGGKVYFTAGNIQTANVHGGYVYCTAGGNIQTANIDGGFVQLFTFNNQGASIDQVNLEKIGELNLYDDGASVNKINMKWGENFLSGTHPKIENNGEIATFSGTGGHITNYGDMGTVDLLDDTQNNSGVAFTNGSWIKEYALPSVETLKMENGYFVNVEAATLKYATIYDGTILHDSSIAIENIQLLESRATKKDVLTPNGAYLSITGPSVVNHLNFSHGSLDLSDSTDDEGAIVRTLNKTTDFEGVISRGRFSEIENELTGMATVTWDEPLNGEIKVSLNGQSLATGAMIADNSVVEVSAKATDDTYKLKNNSFTANSESIIDGKYTIKGDTVFSAKFILSTSTQEWDGASSITVAGKYEVSKPIIITEDISICDGTEIYLTGDGSITVSGSGLLQNKGKINGLVNLTPNRARSTKDNLINDGTIARVKVELGTRLKNNGTIIELAIYGGVALNNKEITKATVNQNGVLENMNSNALINTVTVTNGLIKNVGKALINDLVVDGGNVENLGSTIRNSTLKKGKIVNRTLEGHVGTIENLKTKSGTIENDEGAIISKLELVADNDVVLENKGTITEKVGNLITGYKLSNNTITVEENAYFNTDPSVTITWNPVIPIGSNVLAPVNYHLRVYDNKELAGDPLQDVVYDANMTWGGSSGSKLKHNTTYYFVLEAKIISGNVEKDKIFSYQTIAVTTMPYPEELGALNVDKVTVLPGNDFQFIAYTPLGTPVKIVPLTWSIQGFSGNEITSKDTSISKDGLLHVGIDETSKQIYVTCTRADGYFTSFSAVVSISKNLATLYPITVSAGEGGKAWATQSSAEEDAIILLFAEAKQGYLFDHWETNAGKIILPTNDSPFTQLRMPNEAVNITAHFVKIPDINTITNTPKTGDTITNVGLILLMSSMLIICKLKKKKNKI